MSLAQKNALDYVDEQFSNVPGSNVYTANFKNLRNKENPYMPIPGLKRFCESISKYNRIVIECEGDIAEVRMFFRGCGDIKYDEVRKIEASVVKPTLPPVIAPEEPTIQPVEDKTVSDMVGKDLGKKGMSQTNRERQRERMKEYWRKKKNGTDQKTKS